MFPKVKYTYRSTSYVYRGVIYLSLKERKFILDLLHELFHVYTNILTESCHVGLIKIGLMLDDFWDIVWNFSFYRKKYAKR